jgi:hypothetical protein
VLLGDGNVEAASLAISGTTGLAAYRASNARQIRYRFFDTQAPLSPLGAGHFTVPGQSRLLRADVSVASLGGAFYLGHTTNANTVVPVAEVMSMTPPNTAGTPVVLSDPTKQARCLTLAAAGDRLLAAFVQNGGQTDTIEVQVVDAP